MKKVFSLCLAFVLSVATVFLCTGCKKDISLKEGGKAVVVAADNYIKNHEDYNNFKDTTVEIKYDYDIVNTEEYTYKESEEASEMVTKEHTNNTKISADMSISFKNVKRGEGDAAVNDIYFLVNIVSVEDSDSFYVDEDLLKEEKTKETNTETYTFAAKKESEEYVYYVSHNVSEQVEGEEAQITKSFYKFNDRNDYRASINNYINKINTLIKNGYFNIEEDEIQYISFSKDGSKVEMSKEISIPQFMGDTIVLSTVSHKVTYNGKNLGTLTVKALMESVSNDKFELNVKANVKDSANLISLPSLEGYTEKIFEIQVTSIPSDFDF